MPAPLPETLTPVLERLRKSYTMEAERRIHTGFFGGPPAAEVVEDEGDFDLDAMMF